MRMHTKSELRGMILEVLHPVTKYCLGVYLKDVRQVIKILSWDTHSVSHQILPNIITKVTEECVRERYRH
jgi:hypothetical protein